MFCIYCGSKISEDSTFCPYCGKNQKQKAPGHCHYCGGQIEQDSSFCPYCGSKVIRTNQKKTIERMRFIQFKKLIAELRNRFCIWYVLWLITNIVLLHKSGEAYSNYFNLSNVRPDCWLSSNSSKGIYPENWFYPFRNIISGIMGQDPVYTYDISEFMIYTVLLPIIVAIAITNRKKIFRTKKRAEIFYWVVWFILLWLLILLPMGLLGLDYLGWTCTIGGLIVALYAYHSIKTKYSR